MITEKKFKPNLTHNINYPMRIILSLITIIFFIQDSSAQLLMEPLGTNPVLERAAAEKQKVQLKTFIQLAGEEDASSARNHDCNNIDGAFTSGETLYVTAGDSIVICYNTEVYESVNDISTGLNHGTSVFENSCLKYFADTGVSIGLDDLLQIRFCTDSIEANCFNFSFPIVVKRAGQQTIFPLQTIPGDDIIEICIADLQLEGEIDESSAIPCGAALLGSTYNGYTTDECFLYAASRFAEVDSVCFEICDEYCVCDSYTYFFNAVQTAAPFPFFDDFSYDGPHPDKSMWLNDDVYINTTLPFQPPSVGVATFDGLDETGTPRNVGTARADFLTSNYFSFDATDTDLWLSFWMQNKGFSYPSNPGDSISLEFKNKNGDWVHQVGVDGENLLNEEFPAFQFYKIEIENTFMDTFLIDGFQFRFVNRGNTNSMQDTWHLDYVLLDEGEPTESFDDLAFMYLPSDILRRYSSMPYWHFEGNVSTELDDSIRVAISNLFPGVVEAKDAEVHHNETITGTNLNGVFVIQDPNFDFTSGLKVDFVDSIPDLIFEELTSGFENNFSGSDLLKVERTYTFTSSTTQATSFEGVSRNDEVSHTTVFDNYFAYDDGSAEAAVAIGSVGPRVAIRYRANVADVLHGVSINFPHYDGASDSDLFNIKVWVGSLDSEPIYEEDLLRPFFVDAVYDSLQGFTTYRFEDFNNVATPIDIPAGDFFIGWQNASSLNPVYIGWDRNTTRGVQENLFYNNSATGGQWVSIGDEGAYMIRPIVGTETPGVSKSEEVEIAQPQIKIYPNPATDQLFFQLPFGEFADYSISLLSVSGQTLLQQQLSERLDISRLAAGIYFVRLTDQETGMSQVERVVVQ